MIMEISDVSREQALNYLKLRNIEDKLAVQVFELVGGRIVDLWCAANWIEINWTFDRMYAIEGKKQC